MKKFARSIIVKILGWQVRRLRRKNDFKVVGVVGSIGKTSTKFAIAQVLGSRYKVRFQEGNYNDLVSIPLVFFGKGMPSLFNPLAWLVTLIKCEFQIHKKYPFDIVVLELGTDGPGQIEKFAKYIQLDIGVLTAITPEHMEFFADLDAVAVEELSVSEFSEIVLANADLVDAKYLAHIEKLETYALHADANYRMSKFIFESDGVTFEFNKNDQKLISASHTSISEPHLYSLAAAAAVADKVGMSPDEIVDGFTNVKPVSGRMQLLKGTNNSSIIDDTYNASPEAAKAALETLYRVSAPQKIALLGNMNELGSYSPDAHAELGALCDPAQIEEVITLGPDANEYLASAAEKNGCSVKRCATPYEAGEYLKEIIKPGAVVLAKGSQNGVYAEEAVKLILQEPADASRLVRQSPSWMKKKAQNFK